MKKHSLTPEQVARMTPEQIAERNELVRQHNELTRRIKALRKARKAGDTEIYGANGVPNTLPPSDDKADGLANESILGPKEQPKEVGAIDCQAPTVDARNPFGSRFLQEVIDRTELTEYELRTLRENGVIGGVGADYGGREILQRGLQGLGRRFY